MIPDPHGVSGTFAALERTTPIVQVADGVPTTTSMRIANGMLRLNIAILLTIAIVQGSIALGLAIGLVIIESRR